jgi:two-component system cell cycle response regulator DivK
MNEDKLVLIIDDDNRNIFALTAVLKSKGFKVLSTTSAQQGISILRENRAIKTVLMDIMMPDMDGYEAIRIIRSTPEFDDVQLVAVTAQAMIGDKERCLQAGADAYVSKPINVDLLLQLIDK